MKSEVIGEGMSGMIKILAIGNSFSEDATVYLSKIAKAGNVDAKVVNLFISGCTLDTHWMNISEDNVAYEYQVDGEYIKNISVREALLEDSWDFITLQQGSSHSGIASSYEPYITDISNYVKSLVPNATQLIHQTWSYASDTEHDAFLSYGRDREKMYNLICSAYEEAATNLSISLIPCGDVVQSLSLQKEFDVECGGQSIYSEDGYHMHYVYGRYVTAATWFEYILNGNILENNFIPDADIEVNLELLSVIKGTVHEICLKIKTHQKK